MVMRVVQGNQQLKCERNPCMRFGDEYDTDHADNGRIDDRR